MMENLKTNIKMFLSFKYDVILKFFAKFFAQQWMNIFFFHFIIIGVATVVYGIQGILSEGEGSVQLISSFR
jgi:hypothetical protein